MQTISDKPACALSQFKDWLIRRNIRVIDCWLLLSLAVGGGGAASFVAGGQHPVLHRLRLVSGYSLPLPAPPTLSLIVDQMDQCMAGNRARTPFDLLCIATC